MKLIDTEAAAKALDVSARTIRRWVAEHRLVNHGSDRAIRLDLEEVYRVSAGETGDVR